MKNNEKNNFPETAIVTGAGSGIGRAISIYLGTEGVYVVCISRTEKCKKTAETIRANGGNAVGVVVNLENYESVSRKVNNVIKKISLGRCSIILAAAILGPDNKKILGNLELWEKVFRVNILGNLEVLNCILPTMLETKYGRIIFFSGGGAANKFPTFPAYSASKTALIRIVENLHEDLSKRGDFSIVGIAPGAVDTKMLKKVKASGGVINTECSIDESVEFVSKFFGTRSNKLSGRLIHVRDNWSNIEKIIDDNLQERFWKLRRVEQFV